MFKKTVIVIMVGVLAFLSYPIVLKKMGKCLVYEKSLDQAPQAIIVLSGGSGRVRRAVKEYEKYKKPSFIVTGSGQIYGFERTALMKERACSLGVDRQKVIEENQSKSTRDHPQQIAKILKEKKINRILIVTSAFHTYRSYLCFKKYLGDHIQIGVVAAEDHINYNHWWGSYEMTEKILIEWCKLIVYKLFFL